ncbi:MAG TPA: hypothetical protein VK909_13045, partial [Anaerolineales bacterium]|nr:hypothetical protein [Anaerolineales bacterium]
MNNLKTGHFPPAKRFGLLIHMVIIAILIIMSVYGSANLSRSQMGPSFVLYLLMALLAFVPIPFLGYR